MRLEHLLQSQNGVFRERAMASSICSLLCVGRAAGRPMCAALISPMRFNHIVKIAEEESSLIHGEVH